jgi:hypothetical protein
MRGVLVIAIALAGCRGESAGPAVAARPAAIGGDLIDPGTGADDVIVARVGGRPVWASCVTGHVRTRAITVDQALEDCIALELLAAEAVARGLVEDHATQAELRAALVDGFVGSEFEDKVTSAAALPADLVESNVKKNAMELDRPELRTVVYARAKYTGAPPVARPVAPPVDGPEDRAAHALADEIYAELQGRDDLFPDELFATARRVAGNRFLYIGDKPFVTPRTGYAQTSFAEATFALPVIGMVSPPTRTKWGWDVILLLDIEPARKRGRDELVAEMFPGLRRGYFDQVWSAQIAKGHTVEAFPENLAEPGDEAPEDPEAPADPADPAAPGGSAAGSGAAP